MPADGDPQLAVIARNGWKLIYHHGLNFSELYDSSRDPNETTNLSAVEPARLEALGGELADDYRALRRHKARDVDAQTQLRRRPLSDLSRRRAPAIDDHDVERGHHEQAEHGRDG